METRWLLESFCAWFTGPTLTRDVRQRAQVVMFFTGLLFAHGRRTVAR